MIENPGTQNEKNTSGRFRFVLHCASRYLDTWASLLLTLLAGVIRFYRLAHPCLWYDESMVFWRTCGSYAQLLDCLRTDGFVPLHYSLIWVITRFTRPTPVALRFVPALCGTLMVPAIYFFARELVARKTALLAAAFATCSAFLLFYSRDAKMYMDAWFFVTLNLGCLFWWFETRTTTAWLCWIATGSAACGLHISSIIPVCISPLLLFSQNKLRWQQALLWVAGVMLIVSGPIGHYKKFNTWLDRADDNWNQSGLRWVNDYNQGRSGPEQLRYLASSMAMGWEWPKSIDISNVGARRFFWLSTAAKTIFAIALAACLPWPRRWRGLENDNARSQPQWRIALWLMLLIALPLYGFYCRSVPDFADPIQWSNELRNNWHETVRNNWWALPPAVLLLSGSMYLSFRDRELVPMLLRALGLIAVFATVIGLCWLIAVICTAQAQAAIKSRNPWQSVWVPRYIGFIWPAAAVAMAALVMRLPTRPIRALVIFLLLGLNLTVAGFRILGQTEPPVDQMASDSIAGATPTTHTFTVMNIYRGMQYPGGGNLLTAPGQYYLDLLQNTVTTPVEFKKQNAIRTRFRLFYFPRVSSSEVPAAATSIIIWNQSDLAQHLSDEDQVQRLPGWKLVNETHYIARDCWLLADKATYRRREYVRIPK